MEGYEYHFFLFCYHFYSISYFLPIIVHFSPSPPLDINHPCPPPACSTQSPDTCTQQARAHSPTPIAINRKQEIKAAADISHSRLTHVIILLFQTHFHLRSHDPWLIVHKVRFLAKANLVSVLQQTTPGGR